MSYSVYLLSTIGFPRNHHAIFIETHESGPKAGFLYQVTGNIQNGMIFEHRVSMEPELIVDFIGKESLGVVGKKDYDSGRVKEVVEQCRPPKKQFEGAKRIYPTEPLRRCQEWAAEAIGALRNDSVLS